jgi:hypothetical protein
MATTYADCFPGTAKTWKSSGGDYALTLTSLANNAAREGVKGTFVDGTYGNPAYLAVRVTAAVGSAATNGLQIVYYFGESPSATAGTSNPGNLTGADASLSNSSELTPQMFLIGPLNLSNARSTNVQDQDFVYFPTFAYLIPVVVNSSGQTLSGTAADFVIEVTPYYSRFGY